MAGGVALNCVANGKILKNNAFKNIWIQPAAGDAGGSLGAALAFWYKELGNERNNKPNKEDETTYSVTITNDFGKIYHPAEKYIKKTYD